MSRDPCSVEPDFQSASRCACEHFVLRDTWLIQVVALVLVLIKDSFVDTSFHMCLPCGTKSVARRQGQDEHALSTPPFLLRGLDLPCSVTGIPPGGDAARAGGRRQRRTECLWVPFTVVKEEDVGTVRATPAEGAFPLPCQIPPSAELVQSASPAIFS
jgi:hypothetical protein